MEIIKRFYDKREVLRNLGNRNVDRVFRFKKLGRKEFPCCDFHGECTNFAYAEVYPFMVGEKKGWSYLCKKHYCMEQKRLKWKLPACLSVEW